jgi:glutamate carboxypeptidase
MLEALRRLVEAESFSDDPEGLARCASVIADLGYEILGREPERVGTSLRWSRSGNRPVLLLCHYDTVWPPGTTGAFPFAVADGVARGPGAFDMKAGIVQCLFALRQTDGPVTVLFTGDEEIGSEGSRPLIEEEARSSRAALVLEPAAGRSVKVARKGIGDWHIDVTGRAARAGLEPEKGANAAVELANQILAVGEIARPEAGTTVTVTTMAAGTARNVVPERAWCNLDVRMWTDEEAERVDRELRALRPTVPGTEVRITGKVNRLPMERATTEPLYRRLRGLGYDVGAARVGGGSDGNITAALGIPTLDGLGAVGGGAHARDEHVVIAEMAPRSEMVARLIESLVADG